MSQAKAIVINFILKKDIFSPALLTAMNNINNEDYILERDVSPDYLAGDFNVDYDIDFTAKYLNVAKSFRITPKQLDHSYVNEFARLKRFLKPKLEQYLEEKEPAIKYHSTLFCKFYKANSNPIVYKDFHLDTKSVLIYQTTDLTATLTEIFDRFEDRIVTKLELSSDWVFSNVIHLDVLFLSFQPVQGKGYIKLPPYLQKHYRFIRNVKNPPRHSNSCLLICLLCKLCPENSRCEYSWPRLKRYLHLVNIPSNYPHSTLNLKTYTSDLHEFELSNPTFSINCYIVDKRNNGIVGYRLSKRRGPQYIDFNLLLLNEGDDYHYCLITNLAHLVRELHTKSKNRIYGICRWCLSLFYSRGRYCQHQLLCVDAGGSNANQTVRLPETEEQKSYKFKNIQKTVSLDYGAFCDFETLARPSHIVPQEPLRFENECKKKFGWISTQTEFYHAQTCTRCEENSPCTQIRPTNVTDVHIPYAFAIKTVCLFDPQGQYFPLQIEYDADPIKLGEKFIHSVRNLCQHLYHLTKVNVPCHLSPQEKKYHESRISCHFCSRVFDQKNGIFRTLDHHHASGKYRFTTCQDCNHLLRVQRYLPLNLHNSARYDAHLIIKIISKNTRLVKKVSNIICTSGKSYICFDVHFRCQNCINFLEFEFYQKKKGRKKKKNDSSTFQFPIECTDFCLEDEEEVAYEEEKEKEEKKISMNEKCAPNCTCYEFLQLRVCDSYKHFVASLDKVITSMKGKIKPKNCATCLELGKECDICATLFEEKEIFPHGARYIEERYSHTKTTLTDFTTKGYFCHEYLTDFKQLYTCQSLPAREHFYSKITGEPISDEGYSWAQHIWSVTECKNLFEYSYYYLAGDAINLCDVFCRYAQESMSHFGVDAFQFLTVSGMAHQGLLKQTGTEITLISDVNLYLFYEKALRGGFSVVNKRQQIANHPFLTHYEANKPYVYVNSDDINNCYG